MFNYQTGLVLSGGGARGFAHLGVLQALNEQGIYPDIISGVSAGALVGALYADGYSPGEILSFFTDKRLSRFLEITMPSQGLLKITGLAKVLKERLRAENFEDLKIPLIVGVTNLNKGKMEYVSSGSLRDYVLASATIPGLVKPLVLNGDTYVDGGVLDNFPLKPIWKSCKKVIGVHLNPTVIKGDFPNLISIFEHSFHLAVSKNVRLKAKKCDLFIEPQNLSEYHITDVKKGKEIYSIGYEYTRQILSESIPLHL